MYATLGILSLIFLIGAVMPYLVRLINRRLFKGKNKSLIQCGKWLRKIHKPFGTGMVVVALIHGYLAMGALRLHTGTLAWIMSVVTAVLGVLFYKKKKAVYFVWHKRAALLTVVLTAVHLFFPGALYYLLTM